MRFYDLTYTPSPVSVRNPQLLSKLPTPILSLASHQLAGRGRGSNVWLSPSGCLLFSLLLRVSVSDFPTSQLVFIQYLFSLAVAEACRAESVLGGKAGGRVRLKWPNDIYAVESDSEEVNRENVKKIGGVLVSASFTGRNVDIVIGMVPFIQRDLNVIHHVLGCGLNVLNLQPMTSLAQLQVAAQTNKLSIERTAASVISKFESMWTMFTHGEVSFEPFMDLYLKRWIHSFVLFFSNTCRSATTYASTFFFSFR
jgi:biotin--protein ligase